MPKINNSKVLPYALPQLFDMVLDINAYAEFLPFCIASTIVAKEDNKITADLTIKFKMFTHTYRSLVKYEAKDDLATINAESISSNIFKHLYNSWIFRQLEQGTLVEVEIDFEFNSILLSQILDSLFIKAEQQMIDAFQKRAEEKYGNQN